MRINTVHLVSAVFAVAAFASAAVYGARDAHFVTFDSITTEVGNVRQGEEIRTRFHFRNRGASMATVVSVTPACGVRAILHGGGSTAAGEEGEIEVEIATTAIDGPALHTVAVVLKDPVERTVLLTIRSNVSKEFDVDRKLVDFGAVRAGSVAHQEVRIKLVDSSHRILGARSTDENFAAVLVSGAENGTATVVITTRGGEELGRKFGTIRIGTSSPNMPELVIPVRVTVSGAIQSD